MPVTDVIPSDRSRSKGSATGRAPATSPAVSVLLIEAIGAIKRGPRLATRRRPGREWHSGLAATSCEVVIVAAIGASGAILAVVSVDFVPFRRCRPAARAP